MCLQCVGAAGTAFHAATVIGGPIVYAGYRSARRALGLRDTSVAAREAQANGAAGIAPAPTSRSIALTTSAENCVRAQRRHSASASATLSGS